MDSNAHRRPLVVLILFLIGLAGFALADGRYNKSAFEKVMEDSNKKARVLLGSLVAEDWNKAVDAAEALTDNAGAIAQLTPKQADRIDEFRVFADSLGNAATRMATSAKDHNASESAENLGRLIGACVGCHATFRK